MRQLKTVTARVTPAMAEKWLEGNTHNRPISDKKVKEYAVDMADGKWMLNGETIKFDKDGTLIDGQHRLWACIEAGKPFDTVVIEDVHSDAFATIDTGMRRRAVDVLHVDGLQKHERVHSVAIRNIIKITDGTMLNNMSLPNADILAWYRDHHDITDWVTLAMGRKVWATAYAGHAVSVCYLAAKRYPDKAREFLTSFMLGENLQAGSPILALRNRLGTDKKITQIEKTALMVQAWNAFISGRKLARMVMFAGDKFPTIKGA